MTPKKALKKVFEKAEKEKKDKLLQACLERRHTLNPMVKSADRITRTHALAPQRNLASHLSFNLKKE